MDASLDWLPIAVRAYTAPTKVRQDPEAGTETAPTGTARSPSPATPEFVLVLDTETTVDASQRLLFGSWRTYQHGRCRDEGLFFGDDLQAADRALLKAYAQSHHADTAAPYPKPLP